MGKGDGAQHVLNKQRRSAAASFGTLVEAP
jgi:hypothetical protein